MLALGVLLGRLLCAGFQVLSNRGRWLAAEPSAPPTFVLEATTEPAGSQLWLDGSPSGEGHVRRELPRDGAVHRLEVLSEGHVPTTVLFVDAAPIFSIVLQKLPEH